MPSVTDIAASSSFSGLFDDVDFFPDSVLCQALSSKDAFPLDKNHHLPRVNSTVQRLGEQMDKRPSWQQYFMEMAYLAAKRSTCLRRQVGAVLVRDNQILSTGYNGSPKGVRHCAEIGCLRERKGVPSGQQHELCRGVHAEQNALIQAAINGSSTRGGVLYCTHQPCSICARLIINAEIKTVYCAQAYPDELAEQLFEEAGVELIRFDSASGEIERLI